MRGVHVTSVRAERAVETGVGGHGEEIQDLHELSQKHQVFKSVFVGTKGWIKSLKTGEGCFL